MKGEIIDKSYVKNLTYSVKIFSASNFEDLLRKERFEAGS